MLRRPTTTDFKPRRLPWKRSLQSLLTPEQMNIAVQRETARADRNGAQFALVLFRARNKDQQSLSTVRLAKTILRRVRATDDVGWYDDRHLAALLPDTAPTGAWRFAEQVCTLVSVKAPRPLCSVYSYPTLWFKGELTPESLIQNGQGDPFAAPEPVDTRKGLEHLIPTFLSPVSGEHLGEHLNGERVDDNTPQPGPVVHAVESLLLKPLPWWKRGLDILGAASGMVLLSPLMAVAAVAVKATSAGPMIFTQPRAGLGGKPFKIYKFRTMCEDAESKQAELQKFSEQDGPAFKIKDDPRVTSIGKFLRKSSIDELPQLLNVLKGDMTLVGPRPLPINQSAACEGWHRRRLDVTPGLTCIWQVKGRSQVSFSEWVRMDVAYIRRRTLFNDIRIILQTIPAVLLRRGAR
jgi:lipopolysaccharide/colanic/teichoic acid biosynthesis glycosyltransferase